MTRSTILLLIVLALVSTSCRGQANAQAIGDPEEGQKLFSQLTIGEAPGCSTCHSLEPGKVIVGPSLAGIGARAGERIPNTTAEDYLRNSIVDPNSYVVEGFTQGIMYQKFKDVLTEDQIDNLIAYLLPLK